MGTRTDFWLKSGAEEGIVAVAVRVAVADTGGVMDTVAVTVTIRVRVTVRLDRGV